MGATRKLQGEIDRVLKKVQEGVDVFDSIWNKVYDTENVNQKEKFEADLKKEIKKLQRYRDQIKTWIQSSEIKDKKALLDARKLIEREMERFKVCEKETKTKAFSKEGLGQQPKTDPREKAKGESREWLNSMVSELESQIDSFEAEMEGLQVKKGKTRPPRLIHLEESITRHKKHIGKLEATLRLMENDEVSPDQVTDVKDLVEDYVERNQDSFDEFEDVEQVYEALPLDNIDDTTTLDLISITIPKDKVMTLSGSPNETKHQTMVSPGGTPRMTNLTLEVPDEVLMSEDSGTQTPPTLTTPGVVSPPPFTALSGLVIGSPGPNSTPNTPTTIRGPGLVSTSNGGRAVKTSILLGSTTAVKTKEEERTIPGDRRVVGDTSLTRAQIINRVPSSGPTGPPPPLSLGGSASDSAVVTNNSFGSNPLVSDLSKRTVDDRFGSGGLTQQLGGSLGTPNRAFFQPGTKLVDGNIVGDGTSISDGGLGSGRINYSNQSWRQHTTTNPFQNQTDVYHSRTKIAPDQKQEYVQRFHSQQGLSATAVQQLSQFPSSGQNKQQLHSTQQLLQLLQHQHQQQQQGSSLVQAAQQVGLSTSMQASQTSTDTAITQKPLVTQLSSVANSQNLPQQAQQLSLGSAVSMKENDMGQGSEQQQGQPQELSDDGNNDVTSLSSAFGRTVSLSDEDLKNSDTFNVPISGPGTLAELSQLSREVDFTPGQPVQTVQPSAPGPGVIGRRGTELGAIGDNISNHDQFYNLQMLEAAYRNIPQPKDSERPRSYVPKNWVNVPASYPQTPAPILDNPSLWERLDTDVLFYAFYYQQETYHQYLAARELKKQSWRYHKKYNTWFQRHEEPKVTTDEYEQGTYVYFDFNIMHGDSSQGWCQRIKTEFTFEYSYLEDEIYV